MTRQHPLLFFISLLFLATLACNAFAGDQTEPALDVPPPAVTVVDATAVPGAETPVAGIAPTATLPGSGSGGRYGRCLWQPLRHHAGGSQHPLRPWCGL
jgi:hypothetical protein